VPEPRLFFRFTVRTTVSVAMWEIVIITTRKMESWMMPPFIKKFWRIFARASNVRTLIFMKKIIHLIGTTGWISLAVTLYNPGFGQSPLSKPNIIYIYADDLGYAEIEPYGQAKIKTPNLAKLSQTGMKFTNHYTSTPVCAPA